MSRKVLRNWCRHLSQIFQFLGRPQFRGKQLKPSPFSHPPPTLPLLMTGPIASSYKVQKGRFSCTNFTGDCCFRFSISSPMWLSVFIHKYMERPDTLIPDDFKKRDLAKKQFTIPSMLVHPCMAISLTTDKKGIY